MTKLLPARKRWRNFTLSCFGDEPKSLPRKDWVTESGSSSNHLSNFFYGKRRCPKHMSSLMSATIPSLSSNTGEVLTILSGCVCALLCRRCRHRCCHRHRRHRQRERGRSNRGEREGRERDHDSLFAALAVAEEAGGWVGGEAAVALAGRVGRAGPALPPSHAYTSLPLSPPLAGIPPLLDSFRGSCDDGSDFEMEPTDWTDRPLVRPSNTFLSSFSVTACIPSSVAAAATSSATRPSFRCLAF